MSWNLFLNKIKGQMHSIADLATTPALNVFKNEIPNVSDLAQKKKRLWSKNKKHWG